MGRYYDTRRATYVGCDEVRYGLKASRRRRYWETCDSPSYDCYSCLRSGRRGQDYEATALRGKDGLWCLCLDNEARFSADDGLDTRNLHLGGGDRSDDNVVRCNCPADLRDDGLWRRRRDLCYRATIVANNLCLGCKGLDNGMHLPSLHTRPDDCDRGLRLCLRLRRQDNHCCD